MITYHALFGARISNVAISARLDGSPVLTDAASNHLYRIAQEAVINAIRHNYPKQVRIDLARVDDSLRLRVEDDGRGIGDAPSTSNGLGLRIMRYRAQMLGGSLGIEAADGGGVRVECLCPVTPNRRASAS